MKSRVWPTAVMLLPAVIILALSVLVLELRRRTEAADLATRESLRVDQRLEQALSALTEVEAGQRGFIITGDESFLESYYAGLEQWRAAEAELTAVEPALQPGSLVGLRQLVIQKLALAFKTIEQRRTARPEEAQRLLLTGDGRRLMDAIRRAVAAEREHQRAATVVRTETAARHQRLLAATLLLGTVVATVAAVAGAAILLRYLRALRQNSAELRHANQALQDQAVTLEEHAGALELRGAELSDMAETLRRGEARFRTLIESSSDIIAVRADDGSLTFASPSVESVLGWRADEAVGSKCLDAIHPEDATKARTALARVTAAPGAAIQWEMRVAHRDQSWRILQTQGRLVDDATIGGMIVNARDVTESRHLEEQLRQSQKMDAIGRLAGGIAHDFNNLLTAIQGSVHFALQELPDRHPARADVAGIAAAAERASALTRQLLSFSRNRPTRYEAVNLAALLNDIERMLRRLLGETVELKTKTPADLWRVLADPGQIDQVLINLAVNARDAMPDGGTLAIMARNEVIDQAYSEAHIDVQPGEYVVLTVSDSGVGMDTATRARIFEPFFTTKAVGHGTGLGLSTVYGIVKQSHGHVWVYSEPGVGTTFKIYLPRAVGVEQDAVEEVATPRARTGTILLAEDDVAVRGLARRTLERAGYAVLEAERPEAALTLMEQHAGTVDLLLTDMIMPSMSGGELADLVRRIAPDLPTIFMSGYTEEVVLTRGMLYETDTFLEKPFSPDSLVRCVSRVLGARPGAAHLVKRTS
jgi:two-component system, cell cycle sensor histidine kinase and response regulator CckA